MPSASAAVSGLATRYATALFELAGEAGAQDAVASDLERIGLALDESAELVAMVESPVLSREAQGTAIAAVADKLGASDLTRRFLGVMAKQRRLFALPGAIAGYKKMLSESRGEVEAVVTSATPLSDEQMSALQAKASAFAGKAVALQAEIDPALMGGLTLRVGSKMIDASLKSKLQRLETVMRGMG